MPRDREAVLWHRNDHGERRAALLLAMRTVADRRSSGSALQVYLMLPHKQLPFILLTGRSLLLLSISPHAHPDVKF